MRKVRRSFSIWNTIQSYWKEAFPDEVDVQARIQKRKEDAVKQRELTEKILEGKTILDDHIAEWKRGAIVRISGLGYEEDYDEESAENFLSRLKRSFFTNEKGNDELGDFEEEFTEAGSFKENIQENLSTKMAYTDNVVLSKAKDVYDKVKTKFAPDVYMEMRSRFPDFDIDVFEEELKHIFIDMYNSYLKHDIEYIQKVLGGDAYAKFSGLIASQMKSNLVHKYTDILNVIDFQINSSHLTENKTPLFVCTIKVYEIECLVDKNDPDKVVEGNLGWPTYRDFGFFIIPHPKPDVETIGHEWVIIRCEDRTKSLRLENKSEEQQEESENKQSTKEK